MNGSCDAIITTALWCFATPQNHPFRLRAFVEIYLRFLRLMLFVSSSKIRLIFLWTQLVLEKTTEWMLSSESQRRLLSVMTEHISRLD